MELLLKTGGLLSLLAISYQDFKERKVSLYLFVLSLVSISMLYFNKVSTEDFFINTGNNLAIIVFIFGVLFTYTWFKLKQPLFAVFGIGDALFFLVLACGFPSYTFVVLFVCSLVFSLLMYLVLKPRLENKTVPLAGLQALFLALVFSTNWMFNLINLYR